MLNISNVYLFLLLLSAIISFFLVYYIWRRFVLEKDMNPAKYLMIILAGVFVWSIGAALALWFPSEGLTYFCEQWKYVGIVFIPPTWVLFASSWTGRDNWINIKTVLALFFIPLISLPLIFSDAVHHLFWEKIAYIPVGPYLSTTVVHGPAWWMFWIYAYIMLIIGSFYIFKSAITLQNVYKKQAFLLLIGAFIPWIANILFSL
ncbi:MAG: histidine kinase N-terminal 7TM domain-containing protein, partial [Thermoplasmatota archaeon]